MADEYENPDFEYDEEPFEEVVEDEVENKTGKWWRFPLQLQGFIA